MYTLPSLPWTGVLKKLSAVAVGGVNVQATLARAPSVGAVPLLKMFEWYFDHGTGPLQLATATAQQTTRGRITMSGLSPEARKLSSACLHEASPGAVRGPVVSATVPISCRYLAPLHHRARRLPLTDFKSGDGPMSSVGITAPDYPALLVSVDGLDRPDPE